MAVAFDTPISRGVTEWAAYPEELEFDPQANGRHDLPDICDLIQSLLTFGQLQPVTIRKSEGKPVLVAGFSRWRAISEINEKSLSPVKLKLRCSYTQLTEVQAFLATIEENRVRNETTPMDDAYNIQRLINVYQMTEQKVAEAYRTTPAWVKGRLQLLELTPEAEKAVRSGRVAPSAAKALAKLSKSHQKAVLAKTEGKVTTKDVVSVAPAPAPKKSSPTAISNAIAAILKEDAAERSQWAEDTYENINISVKALDKLRAAFETK
jgi:ParB family transcriptional regulator, chromosome partitioning protein